MSGLFRSFRRWSDRGWRRLDKGFFLFHTSPLLLKIDGVLYMRLKIFEVKYDLWGNGVAPRRSGMSWVNMLFWWISDVWSAVHELPAQFSFITVKRDSHIFNTLKYMLDCIGGAVLWRWKLYICSKFAPSQIWSSGKWYRAEEKWHKLSKHAFFMDVWRLKWNLWITGAISIHNSEIWSYIFNLY